MAQPNPSVFDSLVGSDAPPSPSSDPVAATWLVTCLLRAGSSEPLQQFIGDLRVQDMDSIVDSWARGVDPQPLSPDELKKFVGPGKLFNDGEMNTLLQKHGLTREDLLRRFANVVPEIVPQVMPHGEVPSWRVLQPLLDSLLRQLRASSPQQAR